MVTACAEDAKCLFDRMPEWKTVACSALISAYGQHFHLEAAMQTLDAIAYRNVGSWSSLVAAYADNGSLENSAKVFAMIPDRDPVSWSSMITAYARSGRCNQATKPPD
ncbi:pentatricopeptide repeat-containing protein At4g02750-like [Selaginella moellendorffii]|uniref:pentatricopeptide repeat-containing protein At4g02750-like n=1 Tax=Selaginella moellendorffii TaxID=88036 RepID=UPI000D1C5736|nr:pentatricopeptide repeat-containing protein At4g02750-like [Selaginella moellendorffii]|eukprot:XP_024522327.1 pentatricopeptide repeat-containing protein At4g02750-like [Selaginella moellendorffii]